MYGKEKKDKKDNDFLVIVWVLSIFNLKFIRKKKTYHKSTAKKMQYYTRTVNECRLIDRRKREKVTEKRSYL